MTGVAGPIERAAAERACADAPKQLRVWKLRDRGLSRRQIALALNISVSTVNTQLFEADRKIATELAKEEAA